MCLTAYLSERAGIVGTLFVLLICLYAPQRVSASIKAGTRVEYARTPDSLCAVRNISLARSPMITQGAMVLPVVTRGMMDPSAIRRFSIPYTLSPASTTDMESRPILAVHV